MPRRAAKIDLSADERSSLEHLIRCPSTPQLLAQRARMIVMAGASAGVQETASQLGVWRKTVSYWRQRWRTSEATQTVVERLSDAPRCGAPPTITAEQVCAIVALACMRPRDCGLPFSHWSAGDLAREAVRRGIIESISPRSVGRILKRSRPEAPSCAPLAHAQAGP